MSYTSNGELTDCQCPYLRTPIIKKINGYEMRHDIASIDVETCMRQRHISLAIW